LTEVEGEGFIHITRLQAAPKVAQPNWIVALGLLNAGRCMKKVYRRSPKVKCMVNNAVFDFYAARRSSLQCSDTVGWASGRASGV